MPNDRTPQGIPSHKVPKDLPSQLKYAERHHSPLLQSEVQTRANAVSSVSWRQASAGTKSEAAFGSRASSGKQGLSQGGRAARPLDRDISAFNFHQKSISHSGGSAQEGRVLSRDRLGMHGKGMLLQIWDWEDAGNNGEIASSISGNSLQVRAFNVPQIWCPVTAYLFRHLFFEFTVHTSLHDLSCNTLLSKGCSLSMI